MNLFDKLENLNINFKLVTVILLLVTIAVISITKVTDYTTSLETHEHEIEQIDNKIDSVLKLVGGATAVSAAISLLPDDACTPIAEEIAELAKYFLIVLSVLYLEKYLLTVTGFAAFRFLVPVACLLLGVAFALKKDNKVKFRTLSLKVFIAALVVYCTVPISIKTSDLIYKNYETSINNTINDSIELSEQANESINGVADEEDQGIIDGIVNWVSRKANSAVDYVSGMLSKYIEAFAVMLVTACIIPLLVFLFIIWILKMLFFGNGNTITHYLKSEEFENIVDMKTGYRDNSRI